MIAPPCASASDAFITAAREALASARRPVFTLVDEGDELALGLASRFEAARTGRLVELGERVQVELVSRRS